MVSPSPVPKTILIPIAYNAKPIARGNFREKYGKTRRDVHEIKKFNDLARIVYLLYDYPSVLLLN